MQHVTRHNLTSDLECLSHVPVHLNDVIFDISLRAYVYECGIMKLQFCAGPLGGARPVNYSARPTDWIVKAPECFRAA